MITIVLLLTAVFVCIRAEELALLTATVPFAFVVENVNLPTGMIKVQNLDGGKVATISVVPSQKSGNSERVKLVLHRFRPTSGNKGATSTATCRAAIAPASWPATVTGWSR